MIILEGFCVNNQTMNLHKIILQEFKISYFYLYLICVTSSQKLLNSCDFFLTLFVVYVFYTYMHLNKNFNEGQVKNFLV